MEITLDCYLITVTVEGYLMQLLGSVICVTSYFL